jgi:indole-3-glycerol phosphate synthase
LPEIRFCYEIYISESNESDQHVNFESILSTKRQALAGRKAKTPIEAIRALASMQKRPQPVLGTVTNGAQTVLIGQVCHTSFAGAYDPVSSALRLLRAGFDALALFTDDTVYDEGWNDLSLVSRAVYMPVISQDYLFDEYQVVEARAAGASGLMLYANILDTTTLRALVSATQRNRMTAIAQVGSVDEVQNTLAISPQVIAIHTGDSLNLESLRLLREQIPLHIRAFVSHPLTTMDEVKSVATLRPDAVLVSGALLERLESVDQLRQLLQHPS